jgi:hypothetical protein
MLPDTGTYQVSRRPHPWPRDDHGTPVPSALGAPGAARPGAATKQPDGAWSLRQDPAEWPRHAGDKVTGPDGAVWTVTGVPLLHRNNAASDVDYVAAAASLDPPEVP